MHPTTRIGDTGKPSLALATYRLTWRVFRQQHWRNNCWCQKSAVEQAWSRYHGWQNSSKGGLASMAGEIVALHFFKFFFLFCGTLNAKKKKQIGTTK